MKHLILTFLSVFCLTIISCGNEGSSSKESTETSTVTADNHEGHDHHAHDGHDHEGHSHDHKSEDNVAKPSPMSPYIGVWQPKASSLKGVFKDNRWIEFYADSTFVSGANGKETNKGKWNIDSSTNYMTIDYADNSKVEDEHWKAQLHLPVVVLIGNTDKTKTGEQIKMDKVEKRPGYK